MVEGSIKPCVEVRVELRGDTKDAVMGLWGKRATGSYNHYGEWVQGRPVYYKTEPHNFTLSVLPNHEAWGFSDRADATYAYVVASQRLGPNSPGDVEGWVYFSGHEWKEKGLEEWTNANLTVECALKILF